MALDQNQCCTWNDLAAEVAAGRMAWNGAAQSGTTVVTWAAFTAHVQYDNTNPAGLAATQCPKYNALIARASTIQPPATVTGTNNGPGRLAGSWTPPGSGLAPASYDYQYYRNGLAFGAQGNVAASPPPAMSGYASGDTAAIQVRSVNGAQASAWLSSTPLVIA